MPPLIDAAEITLSCRRLLSRCRHAFADYAMDTLRQLQLMTFRFIAAFAVTIADAAIITTPSHCCRHFADDYHAARPSAAFRQLRCHYVIAAA